MSRILIHKCPMPMAQGALDKLQAVFNQKPVYFGPNATGDMGSYPSYHGYPKGALIWSDLDFNHNFPKGTRLVYTFEQIMEMIENPNLKSPDKMSHESVDVAQAPPSKDGNPKDGIGVRKWRNFACVPMTVFAEVGAGMLEGAAKYGRHNYRVAGVRASVYVDASIGHIMQWWEGEDLDPDSPMALNHITKAITSLVVLRDATIQNMLVDDRPPKANLDKVRADLQKSVDALFEAYPTFKAPFTHVNS